MPRRPRPHLFSSFRRHLALLLLGAVLTGPAAAQGMSGPAAGPRRARQLQTTMGSWYARIRNRVRAGRPGAVLSGPVLGARYALDDRWSGGVYRVDFQGGDVTGSITDPWVEYWLLPPGEGRSTAAAAFLGWHMADYAYVGRDRPFVFPSGDEGAFTDSGAYAGVEGFLSPLPGVEFKALVGWYPQVSWARPWSGRDMHPLYLVGVGWWPSPDVGVDLVGALNPFERDVLVVGGVSARF